MYWMDSKQRSGKKSSPGWARLQGVALPPRLVIEQRGYGYEEEWTHSTVEEDVREVESPGVEAAGE